MKAAYCEIKRGRNCVTVNYYSKEGYGLELGCRKLERERREAYAAKRRRLNRIRENIGAGVGMLGFLLLLCAGGTEEISTIIMTGAAGLVLMVLGGWLGDRFDCYRLLALVFAGLAAGAAVLATAPGLPVYLAGIYMVSIACGIGNGVVFKLVPAYFTKQAGIANGIVAMMGGLGGFFPPLVLSASTLLFSTSVPGFAAFGAFALACLAISLVMRRKTRSS